MTTGERPLNRQVGLVLAFGFVCVVTACGGVHDSPDGGSSSDGGACKYENCACIDNSACPEGTQCYLRPGSGSTPIGTCDRATCAVDSDCDPGLVCEVFDEGCFGPKGCIRGCRENKDCGSDAGCVPAAHTCSNYRSCSVY